MTPLLYYIHEVFCLFNYAYCFVYCRDISELIDKDSANSEKNVTNREKKKIKGKNP